MTGLSFHILVSSYLNCALLHLIRRHLLFWSEQERVLFKKAPYTWYHTDSSADHGPKRQLSKEPLNFIPQSLPRTLENIIRHWRPVISGVIRPPWRKKIINRATAKSAVPLRRNLANTLRLQPSMPRATSLYLNPIAPAQKAKLSWRLQMNEPQRFKA